MAWFKRKEKEAKPSKKETPKKIVSLKESVEESVVQTAVDNFKKNTDLTVNHDGKPYYLGLLLDTNDPAFGGFTIKAIKEGSESGKGQIAEMMKGDSISYYATEDMLNDGIVMFIPDPKTLANMEEFSVLYNAPFKAAFADEEGSVYPTEADVTPKGLESIKTGAVPLEGFLPSDITGEMTPLDGPSEEVEVKNYDAPTEEDVTDEEKFGYETEDNTENVSDTENTEDFTDEVPFDSEYEDYNDMGADFNDTSYNSQPDSGYNDYSAGYDSYEDERTYGERSGYAYMTGDEEEGEDAPELTPDTIDEALERRFFPGDLDLTVSTDTFDSQFMIGNSFIPFDEDREESVLNSALNELSKSANTELLRLHRENLLNKRTKYMELMSMGVSDIMKELEYDIEKDGKYSVLHSEILNRSLEENERKEETIARREKQANELWTERMEAAAEEAAYEAKKRYKERYLKEHEQNIFNIPALIEAEITAKQESALRELLGKRKAEAHRMFEKFTTEVLKTVSQEYKEDLRLERKRAEEWQGKITAYIDDNIKDEKVRIKVLQEELDRDQRINELKDEQIRKIQSLEEEYTIKKNDYEDRLRHLSEDYEQKISNLSDKKDSLYSELLKEKDKLSEEYSILKENHDAVSERIKGEYKDLVENVKAESERWRTEYQAGKDRERRTGIIAVFVVIMVLIAALAIGYIVGSDTNYRLINDKLVPSPDTIIPYFYNLMN